MRRQPAPGGRHEQPRVRCDEEPSSVAGVAANRQADAFMCAHGSPLLGGKDSKYVRPFVRRKRLRSMLSALVASSDAATAASFWAGKTYAHHS